MVFPCIYLSCLKSSSWNNLLWARETPCTSGLFSIRKKFIGCGVAESNRLEIQGHKNAQSIDLNTKSFRPLNRLWSKNEFTRDIVQLIILHRVNCEPCRRLQQKKNGKQTGENCQRADVSGVWIKKNKQRKEIPYELSEIQWKKLVASIQIKHVITPEIRDNLRQLANNLFLPQLLSMLTLFFLLQVLSTKDGVS